MAGSETDVGSGDAMVSSVAVCGRDLAVRSKVLRALARRLPALMNYARTS